MNEQKFKRQVEEIECPNCDGFGAVHSIFRLNRTTVRHSIHCKWCDYSDWWNEESVWFTKPTMAKNNGHLNTK